MFMPLLDSVSLIDLCGVCYPPTAAADVDIDKAVADTHFALFFNHVSVT